MKFAYFFDGSTVLSEGHKKELTMKLRITEVIGITILAITLVFFIVGLNFAADRSKKITRGIINFYEMLKGVQDQMKQMKSQKTVTPTLSFKPASAEVNELQLTFNAVAKTMLLSA